MTTHKVQIYDGEKSTRLEDLPPEAWRAISGGSAEGGLIEKLYSSVPWLWRGVRARAAAMSKMPFVIMQGDEIIDSSLNYENNIGFWPNPPETLALIESSLVLLDRAYLHKDRDPLLKQIRNLRYLVPTTIEPKLDRNVGLIGFKRNIGGETKTIPTDDLVWFWSADPFTEIGPSSKSPVKAAIRAAGVMFNIDTFVESFFLRGMIKASIIATPRGTKRGERDRLKGWINRVVTGVKNAWATNVTAEDVKVIQIGEGISELANTELTKEKREDIAVALGVPQNILFSDDANFATAKQEDFRLYDQTINPQAAFIEHVMNRLLFDDLGLKLKFQPQTLEIFQEEEVQKSAALVNYEQAGIPSWLGVEILGIDLPPETDQDALQKEIVDYMAFKSTLRGASAGNIEEPITASSNGVRSIIDDWLNHALKRQKAGKKIKGTKGAPAFDHAGELDKVMYKSIGAALEKADTPEKIKMVFADAKLWQHYP